MHVSVVESRLRIRGLPRMLAGDASKTSEPDRNWVSSEMGAPMSTRGSAPRERRDGARKTFPTLPPCNLGPVGVRLTFVGWPQGSKIVEEATMHLHVGGSVGIGRGGAPRWRVRCNFLVALAALFMYCSTGPSDPSEFWQLSAKFKFAVVLNSEGYCGAASGVSSKMGAPMSTRGSAPRERRDGARKTFPTLPPCNQPPELSVEPV